MDNLNYTKAYIELQEIVTDIENAEVNIDELEAKIQRASKLLKICKDKLYKTEQNVMQSLEDIAPNTLE